MVSVVQPAISVREELAKIQPFDKSEYYTNYGSQLEGVPYSDPDAVGTNPEATLSPDGTIVGSTDNGSYTKYPDGRLECYWFNTVVTTFSGAAGGVFGAAPVSATFPVVFISNPVVTPELENVSAATCWCGMGIATPSTTSTLITGFSWHGSGQGYLGYRAYGRWQ